MGPFGALVAGYATLIDFLLATPAIAFALGSYLHFLYPGIPVLSSAVFFNIVFILINISGIKESASFSVFITVLAVAELLLFMGIIGPHFKTANYLRDPMPFGWKGVFAALPFAIWFYLAIEGVAMVAEEVNDPVKNIPKGYISGLATLMFLAFGVMILTGGITDWHTLSNIDYPLPEAIAAVLGRNNTLTKIFSGIGLFGLIASFHGTILASSRQVFAMARSGYLPHGLSKVNHRFKTPHWAIVAGGLVSCAALFTGTTSQVIVLSVLGAVVMYIMSMVSLFMLRCKAPGLIRPFRAPFYPVFPTIALLIAVVCLIAIICYNILLSCIFFSGMAIACLLLVVTGKYKTRIKDDILPESVIQ